jgi:hypothetical protein
MMPMPPPGMAPEGASPMPPPGGPPMPSDQGPGRDPAMIEQMVTQALGQMRRLAEGAGLDFDMLVARSSQGAAGGPPMSPPPPPMGAEGPMAGPPPF